MKKILLVAMCAFCTLPVCADPQQVITNEQSYAIINSQKTDKSEDKQSIKNTKSWFCINIIFNEKSKTDNTTVSNPKQ